MALALDEPTDNDAIANEKGYTFCMDKQLLAQVSRVTVNFSYMGFSVDSEVPLSGAGGCGGCAANGGGGCGSGN